MTRPRRTRGAETGGRDGAERGQRAGAGQLVGQEPHLEGGQPAGGDGSRLLAVVKQPEPFAPDKDRDKEPGESLVKWLSNGDVVEQ
ncbi:unnamed protein product, partial [Prorocentrum cordatum]